MARTVAARGVAADRIRIIPNWAPRELQQPPPAEAVAARRADWNLAGRFAVVYSGNLGRVHEFATVLAAARRLRERADILFAFVGGGARRESVRRSVRRAGLENVRFLPPQPRAGLAAALAAADIHLVTLREGFAGLVFPSKLAGALASGRPAVFVGPPDSGIARELREAQAGAAIAAGDAERLAALLAQWQADPGGRADAGRRARALYERRFTFAAALDAWDGLLRALGG
jgi:glycosyltransferase involved in cell wall biosynthesis